MKKLLFVLLCAFCCWQTTNAQETPYVDGDLLIELEEGYTPSDILTKTVQINGQFTGMTEVACLSKIGRIYHLHYNFEGMDQARVLEVVKRIDGVREAQFNHYIQSRAVPTDPQFGSQWHHVDASDNDIDSDLAWNTTTGGSTANGFSIVACVVEPNGLTWGHPDLVGNHWTNSGEIANDGIDNDGNGRVDDFDGWNTPANNDNIANAAHGAGVLGMVGAVANNGNGGAGVNWNIDLMPVVVGSLTEANVIAAYDYALDMRTTFNATNGASGAFVVVTNSSWGIDNANPASYPIWCGFYNTLGNAGILSCASTSNNNVNIDVVGDMPTGCTSPYMISVTATNSSDVRTFSGYGAVGVDLGAPGESVWLPNSSTYQSWSGTSFAGPCVAGAVGLLYSAPCANLGTNAITNPAATAIQVRDAIFDGVDPTAQLAAETTTGGRLNVNNALNNLIAACGAGIPVGCINLTMTDSFGDSWNGAVYNVYNSLGQVVASGTHTFGASSSVQICPGEGCFTFEVTGGSFPSEIGWTIEGANGGVISGGASSSTSITIGGVVNGCNDPAACNYNPSANCNNGTCCYANCVTLNMTDSFGDSWNGATYTITNTLGVTVATGTHTGGPSSANALCLPSGCYTIVTTGGSFPSEIGWSISGANGPVSGGANANVSFTVGTIIDGCMDPAACNYNPTANCADASCVTCANFCASLTMTDSFGDGWNGATYTVTNGFGVVVQTGTLSAFYDDIQVDALCLNAGCYTLAITGGTFPSEIGWTLNGINEGSLSGGASTTVSFTMGGIIDGCGDPAACNYNPSVNCPDASCVYCTNNCVSLTMTDSFGDGWNGATYTVTNAFGVNVATGTLNTFYDDVQIDGLCLDAGCYTFTVSGGTFPSEIAWTLNGVNGGPISGGASTSISFTVGILIDGCGDPAACNYNPNVNCPDASCVYCLTNCVSLTMTDSFGDGWNGATYTVTNAFGVNVATGTLNSFYDDVQVDALCLDPGCYTFSVTGGVFPSEIGWTLNGVNGGPISGGAPSSGISFSVGATIPGCTDPSACNYYPAANCNDGTCVACPNFCLAITMNDSFGDGWNGGEYVVTNSNGVNVAVGTMDSGNGDIDINALCLDAGCYTISISGGLFPGEISWTLNGANEGAISGGAPTSASFTVGIINQGCNDPAACNYDVTSNCNDGSCVYCVTNCVSLTMTDGFGDNWDLATYTIVNSFGITVATGTMNDELGSYDVDGFCLPDGCYTLFITGGTFPSEIGWSLSGINGGTVSGGAPAEVFFTVGTVVIGCTDCTAPNYNPSATCDDGSCLITCTGDFTGDAVIGATDLLVFLGSFGSTGPCLAADLNDDNVVGLADLLIFLGVFGTNCP
jgi:hypothetical protein